MLKELIDFGAGVLNDGGAEIVRRDDFRRRDGECSFDRRKQFISAGGFGDQSQDERPFGKQRRAVIRQRDGLQSQFAIAA